MGFNKPKVKSAAVSEFVSKKVKKDSKKMKNPTVFRRREGSIKSKAWGVLKKLFMILP